MGIGGAAALGAGSIDGGVSTRAPNRASHCHSDHGAVDPTGPRMQRGASMEISPSLIDLADARARHREGVLLVLLATVAWSAGGLFTRLLPFDLWTIVAWRGVFGTLFIGAYVLWRYGRETLGTIRRMGRMGAFITLCSTAAITLFVPAFQRTSVANAFTIYAALPLLLEQAVVPSLRDRLF
jgi:EamA-like transporter family